MNMTWSLLNAFFAFFLGVSHVLAHDPVHNVAEETARIASAPYIAAKPSIEVMPAAVAQSDHRFSSDSILLERRRVHARARAIARRWFDKYGFDPFCVPQSALYQPYPSENIDASMVDRMSGAGLASPPGNLRTPDFSAAGVTDRSRGYWPTLYRRDVAAAAPPKTPSLRARSALRRSMDKIAQFAGVGYPGCFFPGAFARPAGAGYGGPMAQGIGVSDPQPYEYGDLGAGFVH